MTFVIDIGNSNIVLGLFREKELIYSGRIATDHNRTAEEYAALFASIFAINNLDYKRIDGVMISSVVPPLSRSVGWAAEKLSGVTPLFVGPGIKTGFQIKIDNPAQLGSDMVANVAAALTQYQLPLVVIDMGTATTMTVVDQKGDIQGAIICPGVQTSLRALSSGTAQLPHIDLEDAKVLVGKNSIESMRSGIVFGFAALLDGMVDNLAAELGQVPTVIATGGFSSVIIPHCKRDIQLNPDLLLEGLRVLYERNVQKSL